MTARATRRADWHDSLAGAVGDAHHRVDPSAWENIYVLGDVHGCRDALERLLGALEFGPDDLLVAVGDLVRKGPDSPGVLDLVRVHENILSVRGNNEQGLIDGTKSDPALDAEDVAFLESLPLAVSWERALVVHGGVDHRKPLAEHGTEELVSLRSLTGGGYDRPFWFERRREGPRVFFGHTVLSEPFETPYAVGLDTGCVYGGRLTAYDWNGGEFVSIDPGETYRQRSDDSIVSPEQRFTAE